MSKNDSPSKPQRILVEQESSATIAVSTPAFLSLAKRAGKSKYPLTVLEQVYCRGILNSKYHPKNTPEQQAFQRVDSFIHEGKAYELDKDLLSETPIVPDGKKHMHIIKNAIKRHEERNKPEDTTEDPIKEDWASSVGVGLGRLALSALGVGRRKAKSRQPSSPEQTIAKKLQDKEIKYKVDQGWSKMHPELSRKSKNIQRKKDIVRKSFQTGNKVVGEPLRLKTRYQDIRDRRGTREREAAIDYATKKTGIPVDQVKSSLGIPSKVTGRKPVRLSYDQDRAVHTAHQEYWKSKKNK